MQIYDDFFRSLLDNLYDGVYFVDQQRRITYWNKGAERITGFRSEDLLGSHCWDNILTHMDKNGVNLCQHGCPLLQTMSDRQPNEAEIFLHHKDGHRVPVLVRVTPIIDQQGELLGAAEIFSDNSEKVMALQVIEELQGKVFLDPLTGLANRRYLEMNMQARFDEMQRYEWSFGLIMMDIDHFKMVNDNYGHAVGDIALQVVAGTLLNNLRSSDIAGRWGGEEFLAVLSNTGAEKLISIAERFRLLIERSTFPADGKACSITISAGATLARRDDSMISLLERADQLLYESKRTGRNRVTADC